MSSQTQPYINQSWKRSQFDPELIVTAARPNVHIAEIKTTGMGHQVDNIAKLVAAAPDLLKLVAKLAGDVADLCSLVDLDVEEYDSYNEACQILKAIQEGN